MLDRAFASSFMQQEMYLVEGTVSRSDKNVDLSTHGRFRSHPGTHWAGTITNVSVPVTRAEIVSKLRLAPKLGHRDDASRNLSLFCGSDTGCGNSGLDRRFHCL